MDRVTRRDPGGFPAGDAVEWYHGGEGRAGLSSAASSGRGHGGAAGFGRDLTHVQREARPGGGRGGDSQGTR